jgi:hypothetical protein
MLEIDHVFVCCATGAPEASALLQLGFIEGTRNVHVGQGTANRRFFFENAYLELLWVRDAAEALEDRARETRLWERWLRRDRGASPFGIVFRPGETQDTAAPPFRTWSYRPAYLPSPLAIEMAVETTLEEPELIYLPFAGRAGFPSEPAQRQRLVLTSVTVGLPARAPPSAAARACEAQALIRYRYGRDHLLDLDFACDTDFVHDLRPALPLRLRASAGS